eukprot:Skav218406  [mRNA]  locus=scaffold1349:114995:115567:+ [translate_table: standard]
MTTQETRNTLKFTQMCKHWRAKRCRMGNDCNFAHSSEELRQAPSLLATKLCFEFQAKGHCSKGHACNFAHGQEELRSMPVEAISPAKRDQGGMRPMKIKVQKPAPINPNMETLQLKMNQLAALHSSLSLLRPPPGLEMEASKVSWLGNVAGYTDSLASTSFPTTPRDECGSEPMSPLSPFMPQRNEMIWL